MGVIRITTDGSFDPREIEFTAITHGHAHAVTAAIGYLSKHLLPWAINEDHALHEKGDKPTYGFEKKP